MITKNIFLSSLDCPTLGWRTCNNQVPESRSLIDQFNIEEGLQVQERARLLYPDGILITGDNLTCGELTQRFLNNKDINIIFEATFIVDNYITKADILSRSEKGWDLYEVKSSTKIKPELIEDMAYTAMVLNRAKLEINSCKLLLVSKDYRLGMSDKELFEENDVTEEVLCLAGEFDKDWDKISQYLNKNEAPISELKWQCRKCELYENCFNGNTQDTIFELPYIRENNYNELMNAGIFQISDIPGDFKLTPFQKSVRESVINQRPIIDKKGLRFGLKSIIYPAYYLDFETTQTCIPIFEDTAPYTQIPTQYSIHICSSPGKINNHLEYLADHNKDCRRELAENLIRDCGTEGSIITYTSFEKTIIKGLMKSFRDLEGQLNSLIDRIIDLHEIIRNNYYNSEFRGSTSIKKVLPVLVPKLSYDNMNIAEGGAAMAAFAYMVKGRYDDQEIAQIREDLLRYCELDTLAMVRLHERLEEMVDGCV